MITAIVMVAGETGEEDTGGINPVRWVRGARRAAAADLLLQLEAQPQIEQIILVTPELASLEVVGRFIPVISDPGPLHVGRNLSELVQKFKIDRLLYFGGGSVPLLADETLNQIVTQLAANERLVITNNRYASDWAGISPAVVLEPWIERLPQDNMLGWVLSTEAGLPVEDFSPNAPSRLDIDTPIDLITLKLHPRTRPHLRRYLDRLPLDIGRLEQALKVMAAPASHLFIAGRLGPAAWQALNNATQCWIRVFSEERGMVSSGRQGRGEVFSFFADYLEAVGPESFFEKLSGQVQAALIDSRVLLAHHSLWPDEADRFASDLGLVAQIKDPWLRAFTAAAMAAPIPVLLGGHSLLAGDLFAFCEML
jgi:CTP:molybdopterin cytidylyltransferase MocA